LSWALSGHRILPLSKTPGGDTRRPPILNDFEVSIYEIVA